MKVGAEPKKTALLAGLVLLAAYFLYTNVLSSPAGPPAQTAAPMPSAVRSDVPPGAGGPAPRPDVRRPSQSALQEYRPSLKTRKQGERRDLSTIDATLRLDLLDRLQGIRVHGGDRSLFEFSSAPLAETPRRTAEDKPPEQAAAPPPPQPAPSEANLKPPVPRITLKFFGYSTALRQSNRRAFFLDGDEILVGSEGDVLKKRYRVVKIGVSSAVLEDLDTKAEQTLPLEPQAG